MKKAHPWFRSSKNTWYVWLNGRQTSLGVKGAENEQAAYKEWHRLMAEGTKSEPQSVESIRTVRDVIKAFLADSTERVKPKTLEVYRWFLELFESRYGSTPVERLTTGLVETFVRKPTWGSDTRNDCLGVIMNAFKWAERTGLIDRNPIQGVMRPPKTSRGAESVIAAEDHRKLVEAAIGDFKGFLQFLWLTGCRPGEASGITADAYDEKASVVILKEHKTSHRGRVRIIHLTPEALEILKRQRERYGTGLLFRGQAGSRLTVCAVKAKMARLREKTGVKATAYGYRHTFATDALSKGVPEAHVAELLGHSGTTMLHKHYSHLGSKAQVLKQALAFREAS
jgi:integrase